MMLQPCTHFDGITKTWNGPSSVSLYNTDASIGQVLLHSLSLNPDKIGLICDHNGVEISHNDLKLKSIRTAQNLQKLNYKTGDIFGFCTNNNHNLTAIVIGSLTIGACLNPIDPYSRSREIIHMFSQTRPSLIFCNAFNVDVIKNSLKTMNMKEVPIYTLDDQIVEGTHDVKELFVETGTEDIFIPPSIGDGMKQCAVILSTSGTTGMPKAVSLSHASLLDRPYYLEHSSNGVLFGFSTLHWITGLNMLIAAIMCQYVRIITTEPFCPELFLKIVEKYKVTSYFGSPPNLTAILECTKLKKAHLSSLKSVMTGGSHMQSNFITRLKQSLPNAAILIGYGITEISGCISLETIAGNGERMSVGQLAPNLSVKIVTNNGERCTTNIDGELRFRPRYPFLGYYKNENNTKEIFDEEGFLRSGDIGHFDTNGNLYVIDRIKDMIKYKGSTVFPSLIEQCIRNIKGIQDVCVVGIPNVHDVELPAGLIVRSNSGPIVKEDDIHMILKNELSVSQQLHGGIYFFQQMPHNVSGKILKTKVKEMILECYNQREK